MPFKKKLNQQTQNPHRRLYQSDVVRTNEIATNIKGTGDHQWPRGRAGHRSIQNEALMTESSCFQLYTGDCTAHCHNYHHILYCTLVWA